MFKPRRLLGRGGAVSMPGMDRNVMKKRVIGCIAALSLVSVAVIAADGPQGGAGDDAALKTALRKIDAQRKAQEKACRALSRDASNVCRVEARGRATVAEAQLQARHAPGPEAELAVKEARAEADYRVAVERCGSARGDTRKTCRQQAKAAREAALRLATVEKVQADLKRKASADERDREGLAQEKTPQERYAALKAYCELQGPDREQCLADVKRRFGKS
jgi:hypothetical protein